MNTLQAYFRVTLLSALFLEMIAAPPLVWAQEEIEFNINSAATRSLAGSLATRFMHLRPHLDAGVIGLTHDGNIAVYDAAKLDSRTRLEVDTLVAEENKDRATLYREIARANGRPEWESDLRAVFARRWTSRMQAGWFYQSDKGQWAMK